MSEDLLEALRRSLDEVRAARCRCWCHDVDGGPYHDGQKCVCSGGKGFENG